MYKQKNEFIVIRTTDGSSIPADPANTDYAAYLAWLSEGNTPEPADVPPPPTVQDELNALDAENMLTQRNLREFILLTTEAIKVATNNAVDLSLIPGVAKVVSVEGQAVALRARL